jgi:hypothetical protein
MITFTDPTFALYIRAAGCFFRVTAICNTDDEVNDYCVANPGEIGVSGRHAAGPHLHC